jgi:hypothetical protein
MLSVPSPVIAVGVTVNVGDAEQVGVAVYVGVAVKVEVDVTVAMVIKTCGWTFIPFVDGPLMLLSTKNTAGSNPDCETAPFPPPDVSP